MNSFLEKIGVNLKVIYLPDIIYEIQGEWWVMPDWVFHLNKGICRSKITQEIEKMTVQSPQNNQPEETRKDFEIRLIAKAWTDEAFRRLSAPEFPSDL
ncbi:hypothetical protein NUACC26_014550 [Scytonema sp. NUACC26]